jgi:hypothetical protein
MSALILHWKLIVIALLCAALGVQSYRLQGAQGRIVVFEEREAAQLRDKARRDAANFRNKERTDEEDRAARKRAGSVVVRAEPSTRIAVGTLVPRSRDAAAECISRGDVDRVVADFEREHAAGLDAVIAAVSQRHAAEATHVARDAEGVAAAYRACRGFTLGLE